MTNKIILSFLMFTTTVIISINSLELPLIEEYVIPISEVQYELPQTLIGEFIVVTPASKEEITIFPNKEYIIKVHYPRHFAEYWYGNIIKNDNTWYFSPSIECQNYQYFSSLTEIHLTDLGFSYHMESHELFFNAIRRENIPVPENLAENISVPNRIIKNQYFIFSDSVDEKTDYNIVNSSSDYPFRWTHRMQIDKGYVKIIQTDENPGEMLIIFEGFIDKTEENEEVFRGVIKYTNGVAYFYVNDGTADIEIRNDGSIKITMLYTPNSLFLDMLGMSDIHNFPAKLVLEF